MRVYANVFTSINVPERGGRGWLGSFKRKDSRKT